MRIWRSFVVALAAVAGVQPSAATFQRHLSPGELATIADDDIVRHRSDAAYFEGLDIREQRFSENGFDWHLIRFENVAKPVGPLWVVPHDDENGAFEGGIAAVRKYGGVLLTVNSGPGGLRRQSGHGICGVKSKKVKSCDPNRNFDAATPQFTRIFLSERANGQPIIALHTNGAGAAGDFSLLDIDAYSQGRTVLRNGAYRAINPQPEMANYDTLGLIAYPARDGGPDARSIACRTALNQVGIHFWHERVDSSDGSLSNYLALNRPDIAYFNAESRQEVDLAIAANRHGVMIAAYLAGCTVADD